MGDTVVSADVDEGAAAKDVNVGDSNAAYAKSIRGTPHASADTSVRVLLLPPRTAE
jgi:hypothetical protein